MKLRLERGADDKCRKTIFSIFVRFRGEQSLAGTALCRQNSELPLLSDIGGNVVSGLPELAGLLYNCLCFVSKILKFSKIVGGEKIVLTSSFTLSEYKYEFL